MEQLLGLTGQSAGHIGRNVDIDENAGRSERLDDEVAHRERSRVRGGLRGEGEWDGVAHRGRGERISPAQTGVVERLDESSEDHSGLTIRIGYCIAVH